MLASPPLRECAADVPRLFVAVDLGLVKDSTDAAMLRGRGPFETTMSFGGRDAASSFGDASAIVGAIIDMTVAADAKYFVGGMGISTFDRLKSALPAREEPRVRQWFKDCTTALRQGGRERYAPVRATRDESQVALPSVLQNASSDALGKVELCLLLYSLHGFAVLRSSLHSSTLRPRGH